MVSEVPHFQKYKKQPEGTPGMQEDCGLIDFFFQNLQIASKGLLVLGEREHPVF
ncbi:MAG: hypothetical protein HFH80_14625 [Lachnospiraceae bacterium]|nr:hypothetical protein [Lachnospiraceae bacterium]